MSPLAYFKQINRLRKQAMDVGDVNFTEYSEGESLIAAVRLLVALYVIMYFDE